MKHPRLLLLATAVAVALSTAVGADALAAAPSPDRSVGPNHDVQGVVPAKNSASKTAGAGGNLSYHSGGSVMTTNTTYAIYWVPSGYSVSATYRSLIDGFLTNVAADNGKTTNVYASDTQYYQSTGGTQYIAYSSHFATSVIDTNGFPANGCSDSYTSVCLSDAQLQAEIERVRAANNWPRGTSALYFMFTPRGVGSCYASNSCAFSQYCAYHSHYNGTSPASTVLYANQPYTDTVPAACDSGQSPNGDAAADSTINVVSHEHNEAITDALGNAWYDRRGYENGDKCAWNFGTGSGSSNQSIGTGHYFLQQEWSNRSSGCVLQGT